MLVQEDGGAVLMAEAETDGAAGGDLGFGKSFEQVFAERDAAESGLPIETAASEDQNAPEPEGEKVPQAGSESGLGNAEESSLEPKTATEDPPESDWVKSTTGKILESHGLDPTCFKDEAAALRTIDNIERTRQRRREEFEHRQRMQQQQQVLGDRGPQPRFPPQFQQAAPQQQQQVVPPQEQAQQASLQELVEKVKSVDFGGEMNMFVEQMAAELQLQQRQLQEQSAYLRYIQEQELRSYEDAVLRTTAEVGGNLIDKQKLDQLFGLGLPEHSRTDQQRRAIGALMTNAAGYMSGNFGGQKLPLNRDTIEMILVKHVPEIRVDVNSRVANAKALQKQAAMKMGSGSGSRMVVNAPASSRDPNDRESRAGLHAMFNDMKINQT